MTLNPKSKLQELLHSQSMDLPVYTTVRLDGPDHKPVFSCSMKVSGYDVITRTAQSKKEAEKLCAQTLLDRTSPSSSRSEVPIFNPSQPDGQDVLIFIDLENQPKAIDTLLSRYTLDGSCNIYAFVSKLSHLATKTYDHVSVMIAPCSGSDSADTYMTMCIGKVCWKSDVNCVLITRDHFAENACIIMNSIREGSCLHFGSMSQYLDHIETN